MKFKLNLHNSSNAHIRAEIGEAFIKVSQKNGGLSELLKPICTIENRIENEDGTTTLDIIPSDIIELLATMECYPFVAKINSSDNSRLRFKRFNAFNRDGDPKEYTFEELNLDEFILDRLIKIIVDVKPYEIFSIDFTPSKKKEISYKLPNKSS